MLHLVESRRPDPVRAVAALPIEKMSSSSAPDDVTAIVFLLDDDPCVLKSISRLLSSRGWEVETFTDPHSFLEHAQRQLPPVAVIDIWMPLMNGLEVQARLRSVSPSTQVIVLTSMDDPSIRSRAMAAGASAFLLKKVDDDALPASVASAVAKK